MLAAMRLKPQVNRVREATVGGYGDAGAVHQAGRAESGEMRAYLSRASVWRPLGPARTAAAFWISSALALTATISRLLSRARAVANFKYAK